MMKFSRQQNDMAKKDSNKPKGMFVDKSTFYSKQMHIRRGIRRIAKVNLKREVQISQKCETLNAKSKSFCFQRNNLTQSHVHQDHACFINQRNVITLNHKKGPVQKDIGRKNNPENLKCEQYYDKIHKISVSQDYQYKIMKKQLQKNKIFRLAMKSDAAKKTYHLINTDNRFNHQSIQAQSKERCKTKVSETRPRKQIVKYRNQSTISQYQQKSSLAKSMTAKFYSGSKKSSYDWPEENEETEHQEQKKKQKAVFILQKSDNGLYILVNPKRKPIYIHATVEPVKRYQRPLISKLNIKVDSQNMVGPWSKKMTAVSQDDYCSI